MNLSRRGLLKGAAVASGLAVGSRIAGPFVREAKAAGETNHFVHIYFNGGLNAFYSGLANIVAPAFAQQANVKRIADSDIYTDATTWGTFPQIALDHWAAIGMRHGNALHTTPQNQNSGGERAILRDGSNCFLNELAHAMGGDSALKAVHFGDRGVAYQNQPAYMGVPLTRVQNLGDAIKALGSGTPDPNDPDRGLAASSLESSAEMSKRQIDTNPGRLTPLNDAYGSATAQLRKPPPKPVTFAEINTAYGLNNKTVVDSWASMLAGAEIMIRGAGTNVVHICDFGLASWDFHQVSGGLSQNPVLSRQKFTGTGVFANNANRINPIKTFLQRMLSDTERNVVIALSGELVRLPNGDHGDGTVAAVFGKYIKRGISYPVNAQARFAAGTPPPKAFWAAMAAAVKAPGQPFGANPHAALTG